MQDRQQKWAAEVRKIFARHLMEIRVRFYPDQDSAGAAFGLRKGRWGGYERARTEPPLWVIRELPSKFHVPLNWFFGLPDERALDEDEVVIVSLVRAIPDTRRRRHAKELVITVLESFQKGEGTVAQPAGEQSPDQ